MGPMKNSRIAWHSLDSRQFQKACERADAGEIAAMVEVAQSFLLSPEYVWKKSQWDATIESLLVAAAGQGSIAAARLLIDFYGSDRTSYEFRSKRKSYEWTLEAAAMGDSDSAYRIGRKYVDEGNWLTGQEWLLKAARDNHPRAISALAELGEAFGQNDVAVGWMDFLSNPNSEFPEHLKLVPVDEAESLRRTEKQLKALALSGDLDAMAELGSEYIDKGNWIVGQEWLMKAAKARHRESIERLAEWAGAEGHSSVASAWMRFLEDSNLPFPEDIKLVPVGESDSYSSQERQPPEPRLIRNPKEAEQVACEWLKHFGFHDAALTKDGPDGGIDVVSSDMVAQVKFKGNPSTRPDLQQLYGIASHEQKLAIFFSLGGYTSGAVEFAESADIALFEFDFQGVPTPVSNKARDLV